MTVVQHVRDRLARRGARLGARACALLAVAATAAGAQQGQAHPQQPSGNTAVTSPNPRNDDLQPARLAPLPPGMTLDQITTGDAIFHGKGGCFVCHGVEAQGMPAAGDGITAGLAYVPYQWRAIDSLIRAGMPDVQSRSPIGMPARGARGDLSSDEIRRVAAYVWAISQTRGEPWPGGHELHGALVPTPAAATGTASAVPRGAERVPPARPTRGTGAPATVSADAKPANRLKASRTPAERPAGGAR